MSGFQNWWRGCHAADGLEAEFLDCWHCATQEATNAALTTIRELAEENARIRMDLGRLTAAIDLSKMKPL